MKKKKKILIFVLLVFSLSWLKAEFVLLDSDKGKFSFYGFIKLDTIWQDKGVNLLAAPRYALAGDGNLLLTAQNSRFGFKFNSSESKSNFKISGVLEWDLFDTTTPNQMKFRTRQAFLTVQKGKSALICGQTWDLFSPLGPTTLNTNGYLWQVGNVGFRHSQLRYTYLLQNMEFALSLSDPASANGWKAIFPVLQSRFSLKLADKGKIQLGVSAAYGQEKYENSSAVPVYGNRVDIIGVAFDWNIPLVNGFVLKGEYALGKNLSYFLSRSGVYHQADVQKYNGKKVNSLWAQLTYTNKKISAWGGYSFENLTDRNQLGNSELKETSCLMAGSQYLLTGSVSFGIEFSHFRSKLTNDTTSKTNQLWFSVNYNF